MAVLEKELRQERADLIAKARGIYDRCQQLGREPNGEERQEFDLTMKAADVLQGRYQRLELDAANRSLTEPLGRQTDHSQPGRRADVATRSGLVEAKSDPAELRNFESYL